MNTLCLQHFKKIDGALETCSQYTLAVLLIFFSLYSKYHAINYRKLYFIRKSCQFLNPYQYSIQCDYIEFHL